MKNEITKHVEYLFALALKKCGDVNEAEDLTQETLLVTFQYCHLGMWGKLSINIHLKAAFRSHLDIYNENGHLTDQAFAVS